MADTPKDPDEKGFGFAIFPTCCSVVFAIFAVFNNAKGIAPKFSIKAIEQAQNATAQQQAPATQALVVEVDMRTKVLECYGNLGLKVTGVETATSKDLNDALYDCNQRKEAEIKRRRS